MQNYSNPCFVEITLISAQDLRVASSVFCRRLRPFITVTTAQYGDKQVKVYKTKVDDRGDVNPTWGDKFQLSLDQTFFYLRKSGIYLQLYTKHFMMGNTQLGWCLIPVADIVDGLIPVGSTRFLSYRLRNRDGSRGNGVVNIAVKLEGNLPTQHPPQQPVMMSEKNVSDDMVSGIPANMSPERSEFSQEPFSTGRNLLDSVRVEIKPTKNFATLESMQFMGKTSKRQVRK